jgi:hypothetical protein
MMGWGRDILIAWMLVLVRWPATAQLIYPAISLNSQLNFSFCILTPHPLQHQYRLVCSLLLDEHEHIQ